MEEKKSRVLIIGLDGATFDVISPLVAQGKLPHLSKIMREGCYGPLRSTVPPLTPPAWVSFMTGKNPGKHGVYNFMSPSLNPLDKQIRLVSADSIRARTLWDEFNENRLETVAINVPLTYPLPEIKGIMISGLMTPVNCTDFIHPPGLLNEIRHKVGEYQVDYHPLTDYSEKSLSDWLKDYFSIEEKRNRLASHLITNYHWRFFMVVFSLTDRVQHLCWNYYTNSNDHSPKAKKLGKMVCKAYEMADQLIGELLANIDQNTSVFIMSDHGFGSVEKVFFPNKWLLDNGLLHLKKLKFSNFPELYHLQHKKVSIEKMFTKLKFNNLLQYISLGLREKTIPLRLIRKRISSSIVDWSKTKAYADNYGIYINLKGREPCGIVQKGEEYEHIRSEIISALNQLRDPVTNEKIVDYALKKEEVYSGPFFKDAPDVLFMIKDISYLQNNSFYFKRTFIPKKMGNHRMDGIFIAKGKIIKNGVSIHGARIIDIAPTLLYNLGLPIPDDYDGKILIDCFQEEYMVLHKPKFEKAKELDKKTTRPLVYDDEETEMIKKGLKALGYLG